MAPRRGSAIVATANEQRAVSAESADRLPSTLMLDPQEETLMGRPSHEASAPMHAAVDDGGSYTNEPPSAMLSGAASSDSRTSHDYMPNLVFPAPEQSTTEPTEREERAGSGEADGPRPTWSRASTACNRCRYRKIRCDGQTPCSRCADAKAECVITKVTSTENEMARAKKAAAKEAKRLKLEAEGRTLDDDAVNKPSKARRKITAAKARQRKTSVRAKQSEEDAIYPPTDYPPAPYPAVLPSQLSPGAQYSESISPRMNHLEGLSRGYPSRLSQMTSDPVRPSGLVARDSARRFPDSFPGVPAGLYPVESPGLPPLSDRPAIHSEYSPPTAVPFRAYAPPMEAPNHPVISQASLLPARMPTQTSPHSTSYLRQPQLSPSGSPEWEHAPRMPPRSVQIDPSLAMTAPLTSAHDSHITWEPTKASHHGIRRSDETIYYSAPMASTNSRGQERHHNEQARRLNYYGHYDGSLANGNDVHSQLYEHSSTAPAPPTFEPYAQVHSLKLPPIRGEYPLGQGRLSPPDLRPDDGRMGLHGSGWPDRTRTMSPIDFSEAERLHEDDDALTRLDSLRGDSPIHAYYSHQQPMSAPAMMSSHGSHASQDALDRSTEHVSLIQPAGITS
ncbi:uncharacterized protein L969DRAFT_58317 [Mixia osmundae IAM 14324]|uniref:Zn(2)-C6 fungal-type domain-containing protein n=1 Tax=Mixia osmundae (strain CBS 9802 / IAM 14324 / JCM 22182 / KY 12970) TaxID=764103 RepID=G7DXX3_MIXOS|nr:uncharacterized protein L969DRAFT_58317 [Mixia osmundae IAM 14324]KEI41337.1 hypothetical protein L969DRAFT_58317 [Mixia osmundae IAM 14324]GAA95433.1 hypothetical protein E5Q_02087 [Mixia osmundae IAM 14324]